MQMQILRKGLSSLRTAALASLRSVDVATPSVVGSTHHAICASSPMSTAAPLRYAVRHLSFSSWSDLGSQQAKKGVAVEMARLSSVEELRRRPFCTGTVGDSEESQSQSEKENSDAVGELYEYEAPFWKPLKRVKLLSVSSLAATMTSVPVMFALQNSASIDGRIGAVMTVGFFSLFTTGMLHWFSSPYVCFLRHRKGSEAVEVETCSFVATKKIRNFTMDQMERPDGSLRPLVTFEVEGTPFYIDDKHFQYEEFLERIPQDEPFTEEGEEGNSTVTADDDHATHTKDKQEQKLS